MKLLDVRGLEVTYRTFWGPVKAVRGVSFSVSEAERLGIVGESGSGKSTVGLAILRLLPANAIVKGSIIYRGRNIYAMSKRELRSIRGRELSIIFQDPLASLNPTLTVGEQLVNIASSLKPGLRRSEYIELALEALKRARVPDPERVLKSYPHQLSGGMQQRVVIASAIMGRPKLLIADEPTTQLDVTIQAQILMLLKKLSEELRMSLILITHNLGVVAAVCHSVAVMYAGKLVEYGLVRDVLTNPLHPYTTSLLSCIPRVRGERREPKPIPGEPPNMIRPPPGCPFHPRCPHAVERCRREEPPLVEVDGRLVACHQYGG